MRPYEYYLFNLSDAITIFLYIVFALYLIYKLSQKNLFFYRLFIALFIIHTFVTIFYIDFAKTNVADAFGYYSYYLRYPYLKPGDGVLASSDFISFITYPMPHIFKMSMWGTTFIFSAVSLFAYYIILKSVLLMFDKTDVAKFNVISFGIILLPILHFFTLPIGKDALILFCVSLTIYGLITKNYLLIILGLILSGFVRPYMFLFLVIGFGTGFIIFNRKVSIVAKLLFLLVSAGGLSFAIPYLMNSLNLNAISLDSISEKIETFGGYNQGADSSVNLVGEPYIVKVISYLFRPLFFDAKNVIQLAASFENLYWILMVVSIIFNFRKLLRPEIRNVTITLISSALVVLLAMSSIVNNLGLAMRQKNMIFPMLFILFVLSKATYKKDIKIEKEVE